MRLSLNINYTELRGYYMLQKILQLLKEKEFMSLKDLEYSLDIQSSAIEGMLDVLIKKGRIKELEVSSCNGKSCHNGGSCKGCPSSIKDENFYRYFTIAEKVYA